MGPTIVFIVIALAVAIGLLVFTALPHIRGGERTGSDHTSEPRPKKHTSRTGR